MIPIVFTVGIDPVRPFLVASLNNPDGNATGILEFSDDLFGKRLDLLHELVPSAGVIGLLVRSGARPDAENSAHAAANAIDCRFASST
jgi:putative ABC transport system substrate-binding protein